MSNPNEQKKKKCAKLSHCMSCSFILDNELIVTLPLNPHGQGKMLHQCVWFGGDMLAEVVPYRLFTWAGLE